MDNREMLWNQIADVSHNDKPENAVHHKKRCSDENTDSFCSQPGRIRSNGSTKHKKYIDSGTTEINKQSEIRQDIITEAERQRDGIECDRNP